jgi:protein SCO1/2
MKTIRLVLWVLVAAMAVALGWLTYEWQRTENELPANPTEFPLSLSIRTVSRSPRPLSAAARRRCFFGFTHCPEICPTTLFELDGWLRQVDPDGGNIGAYFVTVDPERDTPELLGSYVSGVSDSDHRHLGGTR